MACVMRPERAWEAWGGYVGVWVSGSHNPAQFTTTHARLPGRILVTTALHFWFGRM